MTSIQVEAQISAEQLIRALEQLPPQELDALVDRVLAIRAVRAAPHLPADETELLLRINQGMPEDLRRRYEALVAKRDSATLTPEEHTELCELTDQLEKLEAERVAALAELARLRQTTIPELMRSLGIQPPTYA
ncbi:hypothetical protein [Kallotenue papyrolyticum]|uniref:hypothetical protein n=1 Tax=Kallotenue papyrolyticum TaxID=1325125 RepID=UPI00047854EE|nr:hypothetical protein [Kallotenue papyrolyticum]